MQDDECVCKGNWRLILKEVEHLFNSTYIGYNGQEYTFFGLVHAGDDYYYGMSNKNGVMLLSCVGSIEGHGYTFVRHNNPYDFIII